jgi:hypothetical protein
VCDDLFFCACSETVFISMKVASRRKLLLAVIVAMSALGTVMMPLAALSRRWLFVDTPAHVSIAGTDMVLLSRLSTSYGLFEFCSANAHSEECRDLDFSVETPSIEVLDTCPRTQDDLSWRLVVTAVLLASASVVAIALLVLNIAALQACVAGTEPKGLDLCGCTRIRRRRALVLRAALAFTAFLLSFVGVALYGNTFGQWINCGQHYCHAAAQQIEAQLKRQDFAAGLSVRQDFVVNCGFGFSFAFAVGGCFLFVAVCVLLLLDLLTSGSPAKRSDEESSALVADGGDGDDKPLETVDAESSARNPVASSSTGFPAQATARDAASTGEEKVDDRTDGASTQQRTTSNSTHSSKTLDGDGPAASPITHQADDSVLQSSRTVAEPVQRTAPRKNHRRALEPEGDDWVFSEGDALYWSPSQRLFFDADSGHFYDPESLMWFDPNVGGWYKID